MQIIALIVLLFHLFSFSPLKDEGSIVAASDSKPDLDYSRCTEGMIGVRLPGSVSERCKLIIRNRSQKYTYNLGAGKMEYFPLQLGSGSYDFTILKNTGAKDQYSTILRDSKQVEIKSPFSAFLNSVQMIRWDKDSRAVEKAKNLTLGLKSDGEKVKTIYEYLVNNLQYDYKKLEKLPYDYLPDIDQTLSSRKGICYDYSSTFAAMLRSIGVPTKLVKGYTEKVKGYHAWNEVFLSEEGKWIVVDATFDSQMREAGKKYSMVKDSQTYNKVNEY